MHNLQTYIIFSQLEAGASIFCLSSNQERKLLSYSHPKYRYIGVNEIENAIKMKQYPWEDIEFNIRELSKSSSEIPIYFRQEIDFFNYLNKSSIVNPQKRSFKQKVSQYLPVNDPEI